MVGDLNRSQALEPPGIIMPDYKGNWNVGWTKSGAILTEKVQGKYADLIHFCADEHAEDSTVGRYYLN